MRISKAMSAMMGKTSTSAAEATMMSVMRFTRSRSSSCGVAEKVMSGEVSYVTPSTERDRRTTMFETEPAIGPSPVAVHTTST